MGRMTATPEPDDPLGWLAEEQRRTTTRGEFRDRLASCDETLVAAGRQVAAAIPVVTTGFIEGDRHLAEQTAARSAGVDARCNALEEACFVLIARQSPVGGDLRHLVALLRSIADVQRSGGLLHHVAGALQWVHPPSMPRTLTDLVEQLGEAAGQVFAAGVEAWRTHDGLAANEVADSDDEVDLLQRMLLTEIYAGDQSVEEAVSLALIARYYERIADHGVELARQVTYYLTGERLPADD